MSGQYLGGLNPRPTEVFFYKTNESTALSMNVGYLTCLSLAGVDIERASVSAGPEAARFLCQSE